MFEFSGLAKTEGTVSKDDMDIIVTGAKDDKGGQMRISPDPMLPVLRESLSTVTFGKPETYVGQLLPILRNKTLFQVDIEGMGLSGRIEEAFVKMLVGPGSVRKTLKEYTAQEGK
jgi:fructuronate reductase